jgi:GT2 family glycosyltransferase
MLLSIIIVNYNTFELTCDCIRSIQETTDISYEIILIDNNSKDHQPQEFLDVFPGIKLVSLKKNVGFGRANNIGVDNAKGTYILLLNSDTIVHPNTIRDTVGYLESHQNIDILGCKVLLSDETLQPTVFPYNGESSLLKTAVVFTKRNAVIKEVLKPIHRLLYRRSLQQTSEGNIEKEEITPNYYGGKRIGELAGVFLLLKKSVYLETKGFDPDFFMYYEELEWFINRLCRYNIVYYPFASITHLYGKSDVFGTMTLNSHLSQYLFWYKMSYFHFLLFFFYNLFEIPSRIIMGILQLKNTHFTHVSTIVKAFPYVLWDIPRYSNKFGARKQMLQTKKLRKGQA